MSFILCCLMKKNLSPFLSIGGNCRSPIFRSQFPENRMPVKRVSFPSQARRVDIATGHGIAMVYARKGFRSLKDCYKTPVYKHHLCMRFMAALQAAKTVLAYTMAMPWPVAISTLRAWEGRKACLSRLDSAIPLKLSRIAFSQKKVIFFSKNRSMRAQILFLVPCSPKSDMHSSQSAARQDKKILPLNKTFYYILSRFQPLEESWYVSWLFEPYGMLRKGP